MILLLMTPLLVVILSQTLIRPHPPCRDPLVRLPDTQLCGFASITNTIALDQSLRN